MMAEQNMQEFIEVLSSKAAVPGGGGACAYVAEQVWHLAQWLPI